jgi:hypothetical protein
MPVSSSTDAATVRRQMPSKTEAVKAHKALGRLYEKARRFDAALLVLVEGDMPAECRALAEQIAKEFWK